MAQSDLLAFSPARIAFHADGAWTVHCGASDLLDDDAAIVGWMEA